MRTLMLVLLPLGLTACGGLTGVDAPSPVPCAAPQTLPDRPLTQAEVEVFWGRDRGALRDCGDRIGVAAR